MAEEEQVATEEVEDSSPVEPTAFGFRLSESIVHAIDRRDREFRAPPHHVPARLCRADVFLKLGLRSIIPNVLGSQHRTKSGMGFATFMASLTFVVVLGYILAVSFHRYRVRISLATFHKRRSLQQ